MPHAPGRPAIANDYLSTTRESLYQKLEPTTLSEENHVRRTIAGYVADAAEYLAVTAMLGIEPKWEGPVPWRLPVSCS